MQQPLPAAQLRLSMSWSSTTAISRGWRSCTVKDQCHLLWVQSVAVVRSNDLTFVEDVVDRLQAAGIKTWLFGGWAEELLGLAPPRQHHDVDLLHPAADFGLVDSFMSADRRVTEIAAKRFWHKRAFLYDGIMVELILVQGARSGGFCTVFWGDTMHRWPDDVFTAGIGGLPVASARSVREYRSGHSRLAWTLERASRSPSN
jgi:hypothetical protein